MLTLENDVFYGEFHARGAAIARLIYKPLDRDVVRICDDPNTPHHYCNTVVGPVANRIAHGRFAIGDAQFQVDQNEGDTCLHGGALGLSELEWRGVRDGDTAISFELEIADDHMGFPGPSTFRARYAVEGSQLRITLEAHSPRETYFNLAPHLFFNLTGAPTINDHLLHLHADGYLPTDAKKLPLGGEHPVMDTDFDFRAPSPIGARRIDHTFCPNGNGLREIGCLRGDDLHLTLSSNQMGVQIYTADHIERTHIAIEPQDWPNRINMTDAALHYCKAHETYRNVSLWDFANLPATG